MAEGNKANREKGIASAIAKPSIPIAGPSSAPVVAACTNKVPIMGPVQEKETKESVPAIKNKPAIPPLSALVSILFIHDDGSVNSKAPKNDAAKANSNKKNIKLNKPLVDKLFRASAPKIIVIKRPSTT